MYPKWGVTTILKSAVLFQPKMCFPNMGTGAEWVLIHCHWKTHRCYLDVYGSQDAVLYFVMQSAPVAKVAEMQ